MKPEATSTSFTTLTLLLPAIQPRALQRVIGENSSTTCNTPLPSRFLWSQAVLDV
jgi:hypothetical protein